MWSSAARCTDNHHSGCSAGRQWPPSNAEYLRWLPPAAHGPRSEALCPQHVVGHPDLLFSTRILGQAGPAVRVPGAESELETSVVTVAGVDGPITTALALRDMVPVGFGLRGSGETEG